MAVERTVWFSFHFGGHISAVSLSALNVSALTQTLPQCWDQTPASVSPLAEGRSSPALSPDYPSSSFVLLNFPWLCILCSTVGRSCPLSAGVLDPFLCLKVYS